MHVWSNLETNMRIGELSEHSGVSKDTLRYYEKQGLILPPERSRSGYRAYSSDTLLQVRFIACAKAVGFSLKECKQLLAIFRQRDAYTCEEVKQLAEQKLLAIEEQMKALANMHTTLQNISAACCGGSESAIHCSILGQLESHAKGEQR